MKNINMNKRKLKIQFKHYTFQTRMCMLGVGTFGLIVFTFITIIKEL